VHVPLGAEYPTPDMPLITVPQILSPDFAREMAPRLPVIKEGQFAAQPGKQLYISFTLGRAAFYQTYRVEEIARLACRYKTLLWIGQTMNIHRYWGGQLRTVYERVNTGRIEPVSPETWANVFQDIVYRVARCYGRYSVVVGRGLGKVAGDCVVRTLVIAVGVGCAGGVVGVVVGTIV
jgi:hypothetical protein